MRLDRRYVAFWGNAAVVNPLGKSLRGPADLFELSAFGERASLSAWFDAVTSFAHALEKAIANVITKLGAQYVGSVGDMSASLQYE